MSVRALLRTLALVLILSPGCAKTDFIAKNPELAAIAATWPADEREELNQVLAALPPEERARAVEEFLQTERERITVESVFAKFTPAAPGAGGGLTLRTLPAYPEPFTPQERVRIEALMSDGVLEIVQMGQVGRPLWRVVVVMRAPIEAPIEFPLRADGPLLLVQTERDWVTEPHPYEPSPRTIRLSPSTTGNRTAIDYDIGSARVGSEAFQWSTRLGARAAR